MPFPAPSGSSVPRAIVRAVAAIGLLATVGCTTPYQPGSPYFIEDVRVTAAPGALSPGTAAGIERSIEAVAARAPREGAPKQLNVQVSSFRKANVGASLLIGDSNSMTGAASITSDGVTEWSEDVTAVSDAAVNGIAGALIAAARKKEGVEKQLAERFALAVSKLAYGGKLPAGSPRPSITITPAPDAPAPAAPAANGAVIAGG